MSRRYHHPLDRNQLALRAIAARPALAVLLAALYILGRKLEGAGAPETRGDLSARQAETPTVSYGGARYRARPKLTTILFMGVDKEGEAADAAPRESGQADFLLLLVIDDKAKTITPVQIDRDTMAEISVLNVLGKPSGTKTAQICLAHGFGANARQSGELTANAVSSLLLGSPIDYYAALNLDGIAALNDAVGGITVTLGDDFSSFDPAMRPGVRLKLMGKQAEYYLRQRYGIADGSNEARMVRQRNYLSKWNAALDLQIGESADFVGTLFDELEPYLTTDMKRGRMINIAWNTRDYARAEILRPEGAYVRGEDGFVEFHADEADIAKLVIELFYEAVEDAR